MFFKVLVLVLALSFIKGYDALLVNTVDKLEEVKSPTNEEIEQDDENAKLKVDTKRALGGSKNKQSFGDLSLELAKLYLMEEAARKRKALLNQQKEVNEHSQDKCSKITKVGDPIVHHHSGYTQGTWMRDPSGLLGPEKIWYINSYYSNNKVLEFESMDHFKAGEVHKTYTLPYYIDGTGSVVYGRYLYFNRANTYYIVQYDLVTEKVIRQKYPYTSSIRARKYYYQWGGYNTFDLSIDESGLWALYSYSSYSGKLCATQLDPLTLNSVNTYCGVSSKSMYSIGNAFVACGIVYSIGSYSARTTTINYAYDTTKSSGTNPGIRFVNKFGYNSMVTYNPREKVLYAWDRSRQITYPLEFEKN